MKVRGMKQFLHWIFLIVGLFSLIMLGITVNTYLGYAEEGYGLKMTFHDAWLNDNYLVLRFDFENPGRLDINLVGGNLTLGQVYEIPHGLLPNGQGQENPISPLPGGETTSVVIWIPISDPDLSNIQSRLQVDLDLHLEIYVPERFVTTEITFQGTVEVGL